MDKTIQTGFISLTLWCIFYWKIEEEKRVLEEQIQVLKSKLEKEKKKSERYW